MNDDFLLSYDDICLEPKYSNIKSRSNVDVSTEFLGFNIKLPVIPANMKSVINPKIAKYLSENKYFYVFHRFGNDIDYDDTFSFVKVANEEKWKMISVSTGVNDDTLKQLIKIKHNDFRIDVLTVDIAHGHHVKMEKRIKWIKDNFPNTKVIAGNVVTPEACEKLSEWGADAIKLLIGSGSICSTRYVTGFYIPHVSCIQNCLCPHYFDDNKIVIRKFIDTPIIADGGIKHFGDITKALVLGVDMVMSGYLFASCVDSPAEIINGKKQYFGSTSFQAKGKNKNIEGISIDVERGMCYIDQLESLKQALQSSCSYAGCNKLSGLRNVEWGIMK